MVEFIESGTIGPCVACLIQAAPKDARMDNWATELADDPNKDANLALIEVRLMLVPILGWLSKRGESEERGPLNLVRWPDSWRNFIRADPEFCQLFEFVEHSLDFRNDVSGSERMEIQNYVKENYRPEIIE